MLVSVSNRIVQRIVQNNADIKSIDRRSFWIMEIALKGNLPVLRFPFSFRQKDIGNRIAAFNLRFRLIKLFLHLFEISDGFPLFSFLAEIFQYHNVVSQIMPHSFDILIKRFYFRNMFLQTFQLTGQHRVFFFPPMIFLHVLIQNDCRYNGTIGYRLIQTDDPLIGRMDILNIPFGIRFINIGEKSKRNIADDSR